MTVIRDYLGHAGVATTGRYITTNLQMKREAIQAFWKKAGIEPALLTHCARTSPIIERRDATLLGRSPRTMLDTVWRKHRLQCCQERQRV